MRKHMQGRRTEVVSTEGGFHGRTARRAVGHRHRRQAQPVRAAARSASRSSVTPTSRRCAPRSAERTAAVVLEPVQGEGGVVVPPAGYLAAARAICDAAGALLVVDEVQSGIGRAGEWLLSVAQGVVPDVITLAKGLGGGLPIGAVLATGVAADVLQPGDHGSTFGGNPVSCAAALAVLDTIEGDGLLEHVRALGDRWAASFDAVGHPLLVAHRGLGLWRALELGAPVAPAFEAAARDAGFLVNAVRPTTIRLAPPLVLTPADADRFAAALPALLEAAA